MKPNEAKKLAIQARKTLERVQQYREEAKKEDIPELEREQLLAIARAVEIDGQEWVQVARELAK